ncbi:MAG: helix-turn-helix domain-containing protein, partial [Spirochaetaceae bacterium]|nr:helix-turn-helix domain-containing protein [Spirochaetaceae bacterium]
MKNENSLFWERVKRLLAAHKTTQREFAAYIDVSLGTLQGWLYHKRIPKASYSCRIAEALGVSVEYLYRGKDGGTVEKSITETGVRKEASAAIDKLVYHLALENSKLFGAARLKYTAVKGIP